MSLRCYKQTVFDKRYSMRRKPVYCLIVSDDRRTGSAVARIAVSDCGAVVSDGSRFCSETVSAAAVRAADYARTRPERRWGDKKRVDDEDAARERLLDAAEECFSQFGSSKTSIEDVARQAKVSRSTVYRYFEGRNELLAAAYMRENTAVFVRVKMLMAEQGTFAERVVRVTVRAINALRSGRFLPMLFNSDGALMSSQAIIASKMFYEAATPPCNRSSKRPSLVASSPRTSISRTSSSGTCG